MQEYGVVMFICKLGTHVSRDDYISLILTGTNHSISCPHSYLHGHVFIRVSLKKSVNVGNNGFKACICGYVEYQIYTPDSVLEM